MLGRLGLFACFTFSHTPFRTLCRLCLHHNSLPVSLRAFVPLVFSKKEFFLVFFLFFGEYFPPSFRVREDPNLCRFVQPMCTVVRIGKMRGIGFHSVRVMWTRDTSGFWSPLARSDYGLIPYQLTVSATSYVGCSLSNWTPTDLLVLFFLTDLPLSTTATTSVSFPEFVAVWDTFTLTTET